MAITYLPLLILVLTAAIFSVIAIGLPSLLGPRRYNKTKMEAYESGMIPFADARRRFPIKYYLVAMLFILFDIEVIFLYPWAVVLREMRWAAFIPMGFFLLLLVIGLLYEWRKGALEWTDWSS